MCSRKKIGQKTKSVFKLGRTYLRCEKRLDLPIMNSKGHQREFECDRRRVDYRLESVRTPVSQRRNSVPN